LRFNPTGIVVAAVFYGLVAYAFKSGPDYEYLQAIAAVVLIVAVGWLTVGVIAETPLGPLDQLWRRRTKK
jgi:hypothetical protein